MAEPVSNDSYLLAARDVLESSLNKSREIDFAIRKTGPKFNEIRQELLSLNDSLKQISRGCTLYGIKDKIDRTIGPAASTIKVFDLVYQIARTLSVDDKHYHSSLYDSLATIKQLEEALKLLESNCKLVMFWLKDAAEFLKIHRDIDDDLYYLNVNKSMGILEQLCAVDKRVHGDGGLLSVAFSKLENEFRRLLTDNSIPLLTTSSFDDKTSGFSVELMPLPLLVVEKLEAILERLAANNRLDKCISIYVEVRSSNVQAALQSLDMHFLEIPPLSEFDSVLTVENYIDQWGRQLEFLVKNALALEYRLCNDVFQKFENELWEDCFAMIAVQSGIHAFINFGNTIVGGKKEAIKLLKMVEIFAALNELRMDFNQLFGCKACVNIQTQTRDLIEEIVNGSINIFEELSVQVELQRKSCPPTDGSVPMLVSFVTDYCNELLEDRYKSMLIQILEIQQIWVSSEIFDKGELLFSEEIRKIIMTLELNLETWAKRYEDNTLSNLFMMNNHWYLCKYLEGTKLGELMGEDWLKGHKESVEYYAQRYTKESWGKLATLLNEKDLILFVSGQRAIARDLDHLVKKRIQAFCDTFDDMFRRQSKWVVCDKGLRRKMCQLVIQIIVPAYRSYIQNYLQPLIEKEKGPSSPVGKCVKYIKYTADSMEVMLSSLFQQEQGLAKYQYGSRKCTHFVDKIKNVVTIYASSPAAA